MKKEKWQTSSFKEYVDKETGEVVSTEITKSFTKKIDVESFYMVFIDYISPLYKLKSDTAKSILNYMCSLAEFNEGKVYLTTNKRKQMCEDLGIKTTSLTNNLKLLKKSNLISGLDGDFIINPQIFWKGSTDTRRQLLKDKSIRVTFNIESTVDDSEEKSKVAKPDTKIKDNLNFNKQKSK